MRIMDLGNEVIVQEVYPGVYYDGTKNAVSIRIQVCMRDYPGDLESLTTAEVTACVRGVLDGLLYLCICPDVITVDRYTKEEPACVGEVLEGYQPLPKGFMDFMEVDG